MIFGLATARNLYVKNDSANAPKLGVSTKNHGFLYDRMLLERSKYDF